MKKNEYYKFYKQFYLGKILPKCYFDNLEIPEFIYLHKDRWFQVKNSNVYLLSMFGYETIFDGQRLLISSNIDSPTDFFHCGDEILKINGISPFSKIVESDNLVVDILTSDDNVKTVNIPLSISPIKNNLYSSTQSSNFIKIKLFDSSIFKALIDILNHNTKNITIDLSDCMGGNLNNMLRCLSLFSSKDRVIKLVIQSPQDIKIKELRPLPQLLNICSIESVDFIISNKTASSAEIFCAYIHALYPGEIMGSASRGKSIVLGHRVVDGWNISMPMYKVLLPRKRYNGQSIFYQSGRLMPGKLAQHD